MADEIILFGAEMDTQGYDKGAEKILKGNEAMKASTLELQATNDKLKATNAELGISMEAIANESKDLKTANKSLSDINKELNKDLAFQQKQMTSLESSIKKLNTTTADGKRRAAEIRAEYRTLKVDMAATGQQIAKNNTVIDQNTAKLKANEVQLKTMTTQVRANTEALRANEVGLKNTTKQVAEMEKATGKASGVVGKLWGGLRTLANVLPGLGIAGLIGLISDLAIKFFQAGENLDTLTGKRKLWNEVNEQAAETASKDIAKMEIFRVKLNDLSISETERIRIAKEYNKVADEQNKIDTTQINNLTLINEKIDQQNKLIIARAVALSATAKLGTFADRAVDERLALGTRAKEVGLTEDEFINQTKNLFFERNKFMNQILNKTGSDRAAIIREMKKSGVDARIKSLLGGLDAEDLVSRAEEAEFEMEKAAGILAGLIEPGAFSKGPGGGGGTGEIENVFQQKLAELRTRLATAQLAEFQSEPLIQQKFEEQLNKEFLEIGKLLKEKRLTVAQADILKGLLKQINEIELEKSLSEFRQKQRDAIDRINQLIFDSQVEASTKRIANIRDEFEKENATIEQNFEVTTKALSKKLADMQKAIAQDVKKGLLTEDQAAGKNAILQTIFGDLATEAGTARFNAHLELSFKMFQATLKDAKRVMELELLNLSEGATGAIQLETDRFTAGLIGYEEYQKRITKILKDEARERKKIQLQELNDELKRIQNRLDLTSDAVQRKALEDQQRAVRGQISGLSREIAGDDSKEEQEKDKKRIDSILAYAAAVNNLLSQIASFWSQVNEIEQRSLDRSIALQEKRVENAREIAEKGNAEYLELEQKRLDELERKREENAQKQIAINNALTVSQATVAMISAIAQATASGSPLAAIGAVAATIGAIAAAYAFVTSLQPQSTSFYEGTEYVDAPGRPRGKDTIPARLDIGERVVTAEKNQKYWDTLSAIHNGNIPADVLNNFVNAYNKGIPMIDFMRLNDATNGKIGHDSIEVARKLDTTNEKLDDVVEAVASIAINLKMDQDGFAGSVSSYLNKMAKKKNA